MQHWLVVTSPENFKFNREHVQFKRYYRKLKEAVYKDKRELDLVK